MSSGELNRQIDLAKRQEAWLDDPRREALEDALWERWNEEKGEQEYLENLRREEHEERMEARARLMAEDEGKDFDRLNPAQTRKILEEAREALAWEVEKRGNGGL